MRFLSILLVLTSTLLLLDCGITKPDTSPIAECHGDQCRKELLTAMNDIGAIELSQSKVINENLRQEKYNEIRRVIGRFRDPQLLLTLALLTRSIQRSCAELICEKESLNSASYNLAFWFIVETLAKDREKNKDVLERLKFHALLNDTESGDWGSIVDGKPFP